jgi:phosphoribosylamine---glycine ligase
MNILLLGSGGREHALAWKIAQSPSCKKLYIAPGNAGTRECGINIPITVTDFKSIGNFVLDHKINVVVVGPEDPLVKGIHDYFLADILLRKVTVIGPSQKGAMLEGSKDFAKSFMFKHNIPTASYKTFSKSTLQQAYQFIDTLKPPFVIKADGLAAGKGVIILEDPIGAKQELETIFSGKFGSAGDKVIIEEFLKGIELSVFVITDGKNYCLLPEAKDYKRIGEGDTGPNTGGMGSVSSVPFAHGNFMKKVDEEIIKPTINGLLQDKIPYKGFIFFGLINVMGNPFVIEYNARLGDPETESVMPRLKTDILEFFDGIAGGGLGKIKTETDSRFATAVMMVSGGYPGSYQKGLKISGLENISDSLVFHAGTRFDEKNKEIVTEGGRVLAVTSYGETIEKALSLSYKNVARISFDGSNYRKDIGFDL